MKNGIKASAKLVSAVLIALLLATFFTTACQPTPVIPPVIDKRTGLAEVVVKANKSKEDLAQEKQAIDAQIKALGGHMEMNIKANPKVTIHVDAAIVPPGDRELPLVRVRPRNLSQAQFETFAKFVTNSQPLYYSGDSPATGSDTREEIAAMLTRYKGYAAKAANGGLPSGMKNGLDAYITNLEQTYPDASSKAELKPYDGTLVTDTSGQIDSTCTRLKCFMGKDRAAMLQFVQTNNQIGSYMDFDQFDPYTTLEPYAGIDADRIKIHYQQAKTMAEELVQKVDGENSSMMLYESSIGCRIGGYDGYTRETSPQAYQFDFVRNYNDVPVRRISYLDCNGENVDYSRQVAPEYFKIVIDDNGIHSAYCTDYTQFMEKVADDMPLLDFDKIKAIFEQHCRLEFSWVPPDTSLPPGLTTTLNVKRVELNLMFTPEKDNVENYITVPVWDFIGDEDYDQKVVEQDGSTVEGEKNISILTINAVIGSIIDREQGY